MLRSFRATQGDVAFQRQFHFTEKLGLGFRGEFYPHLQSPNFGPPDNNITDARPLDTDAPSSLGSGGANGGLNPLYHIDGPRSIQFAARCNFDEGG